MVAKITKNNGSGHIEWISSFLDYLIFMLKIIAPQVLSMIRFYQIPAVYKNLNFNRRKQKKTGISSGLLVPFGGVDWN